MQALWRVVLWILEIAAALAVMPLVMIYVVAGLTFNLLRALIVPLLVLCIAVVTVLWMTGLLSPAAAWLPWG